MTSKQREHKCMTNHDLTLLLAGNTSHSINSR